MMMMMMKGSLLLVLAVVACVAMADKWDELDTFLQSTIDQKAWPGVVAAVFDENKVYYRRAVGKYTYGIPPPQSTGKVPDMTFDTLFDMASCTKLLATTTAVANLYDKGLLDIDAPVTKYLPSFASNGKDNIMVRNLLLHNSGLKVDPDPGYSSEVFGCPETSKTSPQEVFTCRQKCFESLMDETPTHAPGASYEYSDENFMTLMNVVGKIVRQNGLVTELELRKDCMAAGTSDDDDGSLQCYFEAYTRKIHSMVGLKSTGFLPDRSVWSRCAPTENETETSGYRHRQLQGEVHDENTFAMGGISGHAGLFSTVDDVIALLRAWLFAPQTSSSNILFNSTTTTLFVTQANHSQSSRALGWNTNADDADDYGFSHGCGTLSTQTFMHTGYTGPTICADPVRRIGTVMLCNRVYPDRSTGGLWVSLRRDFNTLVQKIWDN